MSFEAHTVIGSQFQSEGAEMPKARFPITLIATCSFSVKVSSDEQ